MEVIRLNVFEYFPAFRKTNKSKLMVQCQDDETRFLFKGNFEAACRNDGCCSIL